MLEEVKFVFDGSPKSFHYPNNPEVGNLGWTEGWVQFNTAYKLRMAYLAHYYTKINLTNGNKKELIIRLEAPINFDPTLSESITVFLQNEEGQKISVSLKEETPFSNVLTGHISYSKNSLKSGKEKINWKTGSTVTVSYGLGYFQKNANYTRTE